MDGLLHCSILRAKLVQKVVGLAVMRVVDTASSCLEPHQPSLLLADLLAQCC